jgi:hypothetical protein
MDNPEKLATYCVNLFEILVLWELLGNHELVSFLGVQEISSVLGKSSVEWSYRKISELRNILWKTQVYLYTFPFNQESSGLLDKVWIW